MLNQTVLSRAREQTWHAWPVPTCSSQFWVKGEEQSHIGPQESFASLLYMGTSVSVPLVTLNHLGGKLVMSLLQSKSQKWQSGTIEPAALLDIWADYRKAHIRICHFVEWQFSAIFHISGLLLDIRNCSLKLTKSFLQFNLNLNIP